MAARSEATWEQKMERLRRRSLPERVLQICDDTARRTEYDAAKRAADRAQLLADGDPDNAALAARATAAAERYETARRAFDTASVSLCFRALPRPVLEELIHAHPPTDQQAADGAAFNPDTFPAALVAASSTDGMSETEARELLDSWSAPDANALWEAAWQVQQESRADLGKD
ncbi:hypothetical protein [Streptomyces sp. AK08-02]|uniref:hypothetical protein n=1 Tax=Streptomyces sp. AK08-02 TaxID=3028654 RepID=UPI0029A51FFF|nr:hypothetical protein [Streptomyces sp. AK08-02]MDX3749621.1 hypothetical protein [Streptomyces sp. AK08-02]